MGIEASLRPSLTVLELLGGSRLHKGLCAGEQPAQHSGRSREDCGTRGAPQTSSKSSCSFLPDLHAVFNIVCDNVGKDWRRLARHLGVSDAKIDGIEERYPRNLTERVRESLRVWRNGEREKATVAGLVEALRACHMNLVADLVEEEQQARGLQNRGEAVSPMQWDSDTHPSQAP